LVVLVHKETVDTLHYRIWLARPEDKHLRNSATHWCQQ
jgi:hypothetical protein